MKKEKSCGLLLFSASEPKNFLLMQHADRLDLPKGHIEEHETELECALRELKEETGIDARDIKLNNQFRFEEQYIAQYKKHSYAKTLVIFLAILKKPVEILLTEHIGFQWQKWNPPHSIQEKTIDPLLAEVAKFLSE